MTGYSGRVRGLRASLSLAWLIWILSGCAYKVALSATPTTAEATLPSGQRVVTPTVVQLRWVPFGKQVVSITAPEHRTLSVDLRKEEIKWSRYLTDTLFRPATLFGSPRAEVRLVLIPEHGPAGTWDPSEVD